MFGRRRSIDTEDVISASEALVEGRYAEYLEQEGHPVPVWAWMNVLAHGPDEVLRRIAAQLPAPWRRRVGLWHRARAYLAGEVLDAVSRFGTLRAAPEPSRPADAVGTRTPVRLLNCSAMVDRAETSRTLGEGASPRRR